MKGELFDAVLVRQKKPWRRNTGERVCFSDNAVVLLKDDKGNPKGTHRFACVSVYASGQDMAVV